MINDTKQGDTYVDDTFEGGFVGFMSIGGQTAFENLEIPGGECSETCHCNGEYSICNDGRDPEAFVEEIGDVMVAYCQIDDENGYAAYQGDTPSGPPRMYYEPNIDLNGEQGSGYVIFHEDDIKAYCLGETDPLNCAYKWVTRDWQDGVWFIDTNMNTLVCPQECDDTDSDTDTDTDTITDG